MNRGRSTLNDTPRISEDLKRLISATDAILHGLDEFNSSPFEKFDILIMALMTALSEHTPDEKLLRVGVDAAHARMLAHVEVFAYAQACRRDRRSAVQQ